jgi:AcrR family transcriptional regulator
MAKTLRQNGAASRRLVLTRAIDLAAAGGLQSATIGSLADALGMSKSGVFALFGSKDALDAAVVDTAASLFEREVVAPALAAPPGVARLAARVEGWLAAANAASAPLTVLGLDPRGLSATARDRLRAWRGEWRQMLAADVDDARRTGELGPATGAAQVAFEIEALLDAAAREAAPAGTALMAARRAIEIRLQQLAAER